MYIEKIKSPADLKSLDLKALNIVADETRQAVLNRVSKHGGHIGPNLGFVEATVALHYVFDAPKDKFVFDVSHQCYPPQGADGTRGGLSRRRQRDERHQRLFVARRKSDV